MYLDGFPNLKTQIYRTIRSRVFLYVRLRGIIFLCFCLFDGERVFDWSWLRFDVLFGLVLVSEALAGHFVGFGVFDIFRDGVVILAVGVGLFIEIHGVLLDAFLDAA